MILSVFKEFYNTQKNLFSSPLIDFIYIFSAVSVCSNPRVGTLPRTKISFFLLSIYGDELISTPKIIIFLKQYFSKTNLINNVNVYYFSIILHNFILL